MQNLELAIIYYNSKPITFIRNIYTKLHFSLKLKTLTDSERSGGEVGGGRCQSFLVCPQLDAISDSCHRGVDRVAGMTHSRVFSFCDCLS